MCDRFGGLHVQHFVTQLHFSSDHVESTRTFGNSVLFTTGGSLVLVTSCSLKTGI